MIWVDTIVQGLLLGALYALFATGLSLVFGSKGWQASARWNGNTGGTVEHDADPVAAALRALASTTRYDHAVEAAVAAPTASAGVFD